MMYFITRFLCFVASHSFWQSFQILAY